MAKGKPWLLILPFWAGRKELTMGVVYFAVGVFLLLFCAVFVSNLFVRRQRKRGRFPGKGAATLEDVRKLAQKGELVLAERAYREVTGASLREAKAYVEAIGMERQGEK